MNRVLRLKIIIFFVDILSMGLSFILSTYLYLGVVKQDYDFLQATINYSFMLYMISYIIAEIVQENRNYKFLSRNKFQEFRNVIRTLGIALLTLTLLTFSLKIDSNLSRGVVFLSFVVNLVLTCIFRAILKNNYHEFMGKSLSNIVVVTDSNRLKNGKYLNAMKKGLMAHIIGVVQIDDENPSSDYEVICSLEELIRFTKDNVVDAVVISINANNYNKVEQIIFELKQMGVVIHFGVDNVPHLENGLSQLNFIGEYPVITNALALHHDAQLLVKRTFDIVFGLLGSIITIIVALVLGPIIKAESEGPVFFKQLRVGRNGRTFYMYKFRSMGVDAESRKKDLMQYNEVDGNMFKMTNDPRVTKVGKFIRATSIDELPQFFNILKGDMSLIGTRPPTLDEVNLYKTHHKRRLSMKPGLTGMWQVSGRSDIQDFEEVVKLDLKYIDTFCIRLDIFIFIKTIKVVIMKVGSK